MEGSWHSYPPVYALGHKALDGLLDGPVLVEEKVDGSQFSMGVFEENESFHGGLRCRSKGADIHIEAPEAMFTKAVETAQALIPQLHIGWTYRCEYLAKPKHNALAYDRVPEKNLIVFDINTGHEEYMTWEEKAVVAHGLGLETVPYIYEGPVTELEMFRGFLERTSILGGQKIEGVVVKNYSRFGPDKKVLMGKFVSEAFKEVHGGEWKAANPTNKDIIQSLVGMYRTPARWNKAVQHLREAGILEQSPRDIGLLFKEVHTDIDKECQDEIAAKLLQWAMPHVKRGASAGLAEWYKEELLKMAFEA